MPRGDWDDISAAQRHALRTLRDTATGTSYAANLRGVRLATLRALHRFGLVRSDDVVIGADSVVTLTESGRISAGESSLEDVV